MTGRCPDADRIRGLVDGSLSDAEADELQLHIESCQTCQAAIQELVADGTFWESVGEHLGAEQSSGPELERVMEELRQQSPEEAEQIGEAIELKLSFIDPPVEPGTIGRLQHYDILRVAGRGGMGIVVKAFDRSLRRVVAIKLLAPHLAGNGQARQRFVREGRAAAGICHEHVITIHAVEENPPYLVMQFVQGETLEARIHRNGALDFRETVRIAKQIAQGLAAAHAQGVVHRDIKPANILLENGVARVRITDFGLARAVDDASLTQSGVVAGTPQYMAPEQASGDAVDERADLFSLGSVIYTMLAGHAPFRATTAMGVLKRLCDHSARPIREINPDVPDWLVLIINRLHAKRPADRFQSADEVAELLERGLASLQHGLAPTIDVRPVETESSATSASKTAPSADVHTPVQTSGASDSDRAVPGWLLLRVPVWVSLIPAVLFLTIVLSNVRSDRDALALTGITIATVALWLGWKWMTKDSESADGAASDTARPTTRAARLVSRARDILPVSWQNRVFWLAVWALPIGVWTTVFFYEEKLALSRPATFLVDSDAKMLITAGGVIVLWPLIAIVWFRRKRPDGSRLFPRGRVWRVLPVLVLAAVFCSCGLWTWYSDVHYLVEQRLVFVRTEPDGTAQVVSSASAEYQVKVTFEKPITGTHLFLEAPGPWGQTGLAFGAEQSGITISGIGIAPGTYPWRASVGQTEFAAGEVQLGPDRVAEITVPAPRLQQLIAGRWQWQLPFEEMPGYGMSAPGMTDGEDGQEQPAVEYEFDSHRVLVVTHERGMANGQPARLDRSEFSIEIDDSVDPALINLFGQDDRRVAGILRFVPGRTYGASLAGSGGMMGMGGENVGAGWAGMKMTGGGGMGGFASAASGDVLELCINDGSGLRPWEFKSNYQAGQTLFRLHRVKSSKTLREEMSFQPVPTAASAETVEEAIAAWSQRLKVQREATNSLGMELVLVPPAESKSITPSPLPITLPPSAARAYGEDNPASNALDPNSGSGMSSRVPDVSVSYPFVMSRRPVSMSQFRQFVDATGYVTDAERGAALPKPARRLFRDFFGGTTVITESEDAQPAESGNAPPITNPGGWVRDEDGLDFLSDLNWRLETLDAETREAAGPDSPVVVISWRDAVEFCKWLSTQEKRQYRLPTAHEWAAAMQLGISRLPPGSNVEVNNSSTPAYSDFDSRAEHLLGLQASQALFAEWTDERTDPLHRILARRFVSKDGSRFGWSPQYSAGQTFRADSIGFRVVAELQVLSDGDAKESPTEQP